MIITLSFLYPEPGTEFKIAHTVLKLVRQRLIADVIEPAGLLKDANFEHLSLIVATKADCSRVEARGPDHNKRTRTVTWALWLPYAPIVRNADQRQAFMEHLFDALAIVIEHYGGDRTNVINLGRDLMKAVVENDNHIHIDSSN